MCSVSNIFYVLPLRYDKWLYWPLHCIYEIDEKRITKANAGEEFKTLVNK